MKVGTTRHLPGPAFRLLDDVEILPAPLPEGLAGKPRPQVEALIVLGESVGPPLLDLLPGLRLIANCGVGYDHIDVSECRRRGICITYTPDVVVGATADLAFALLFAVRRRVVEADAFVRAGRWPGSGPDPVLARDVTGSTLGIVGLGRIGTAVARRARAFEMRVVYTARGRRLPDVERELGIEYRDLDDLLREVDTVTLHCPLNRETTSLLDARRLALLVDNACVINTARGAIVDEAALTHELRRGRLLAGLDVFGTEPEIAAELLGLPNVVLTPHVGTSTVETRAAMTDLIVRNILAFAAGEPLVTPIPGSAGPSSG